MIDGINQLPAQTYFTILGHEIDHSKQWNQPIWLS